MSAFTSRILLLVCALFVLLVGSVDAQSGSDKAKELRKLSHSSHSNVISLNPQQYKHFLLGKSRPYVVVMLYTVQNLDQCQACVPVQRAINTISSAYHDAGAALPSKTESGVTLKSVFFATAFYDRPDHQDIFRMHEFQYLPMVVVTQPGTFDESGTPIKVKQSHVCRVDTVAQDKLEATLLACINKHTMRQISFPENVAAYMSLFGGALIFAIYVLFALLNPDSWISRIARSWVNWFLVGMVAYWCSTAGLVFNILHEIPWSIPTKSGEQYITQQSGQQLGAEGFIMGGLGLTCAICLIAALEGSKRVHSRLVQRLIVLGCIIVFTLCYRRYLEVYRLKNPWYHMSFFPPADYQRGTLRKNQGHTY